MSEGRKHTVFALLSCILSHGGLAAAGQGGPWNQPSGSAASFTFSNGQDLNGHFGEPVVTGDTFFFPSLNFAASASNGASDGRFDVVSFDIMPNPGLSFSLLRITAFGNYAIIGPGLASLHVDTSAQLSENGGLGRIFSAPMITIPSFPQTSGDSGWTGLSTLDLGFKDPPLHDSLHFQFAAGVSANSGAGGSAEIDLQLQGGLTFHFLPEPGSLGLVLLGAAACALRPVRRRR